jgi:hypothetical protein
MRVGERRLLVRFRPSCGGAAYLLVLKLADHICRRGVLASSLVSFLREKVSENGDYDRGSWSRRLNRYVL